MPTISPASQVKSETFAAKLETALAELEMDHEEVSEAIVTVIPFSPLPSPSEITSLGGQLARELSQEAKNGANGLKSSQPHKASSAFEKSTARSSKVAPS